MRRERLGEAILSGCTGELMSLARSDSTGSTHSMQHGGVPEMLLGLCYNATTGRLNVEVVKGSHFSTYVLITEIFAFKSIAYLKAGPEQFLTYITIASYTGQGQGPGGAVISQLWSFSFQFGIGEIGPKCFIPPRGDLSMLFNEPEIQYKYKNIVDNTQDEPGDSICCKQKKRFWILLRMILQRVLEKLHVRNLALNKAPDTYVKLNLVSSTGQELAHSKTSVALFQLADVTLMVAVYNRKGVKRKKWLDGSASGLNSNDAWARTCTLDGYEGISTRTDMSMACAGSIIAI
ncbi:hypothetical protein NQ317_000303, partial [Molorchus minor]